MSFVQKPEKEYYTEYKDGPCVWEYISVRECESSQKMMKKYCNAVQLLLRKAL